MPLLHLEPLPPKLTKGELLEFVCRVGAIDGKHVGRIDLRGRVATVEIADAHAARLVKALDGAVLREGRLRAWSTGMAAPPSSDDYFARLARLMELESQAEAEQARDRASRGADAERGGDCLTDLIVAEELSGLGCPFVVSLTKRDRAQRLPWNRLEAGKPVLLTEKGTTESGSRAVVFERTERALRLALNEPLADTGGTGVYRVHLWSDETTRVRMRAALERARTAQRDRLAELRPVLLGETPPAFGDETDEAPLDPSLNESQRAAVRFALAARDVALIHGPPGTGKTTAVVEVIRRAVTRGEKVLACAPSNAAIDNLLEKLLVHGEKAVRLGHPARVQPALREHTLDVLVDGQDASRQARKFAKEAFSLFRKAGKWTRAKPEPGARRDQKQEARALLAEARKLEMEAVERVLNAATVVCATLTGLDSEVLGQRQFDLAVIDEACQTTEPACWIPLPRCRRLVLAGDPCQLPPTVLSAEASAQGYNVSLMERLAQHYGDAATRLLTVQYRMHRHIMEFSSREFYDGRLSAAASVSGHLLRDLPGVTPCDLTETPIHFIDTAGASYDEEQEPDGESRCNPDEGRLVARKVRELLANGLPADAIAVIAPYAAQVRLLRDLLPVDGVEIDSVDGFQGREKEAVVVSLTRSNRECEVGFLADTRRMNVALTRARRKLVVVGDSATLSAHPFYQSMFTYFEEMEAYHTVWEEMDG